jgi:hypothetical protein
LPPFWTINIHDQEPNMPGNPGPNPSGPGGPPPREATYLESDEEINQAIEALNAKRKAKLKAGSVRAPTPAEREAVVDDAVPAERPRDRPPMALLCILDDGKADGEWVRLRGDRCLIGRTEGDVRIPHDGMMSGRHAEITRQRVADGYRWFLTDQRSTNGTFVRVGSTVLVHQAEFLIGRGRYRFESGTSGQITTPELPQSPTSGTMPWAGESMRFGGPTLIEVVAGGDGQRFPLNLPEQWIGRDPKACRIVRPDDTLVNARHARLYRDPKGHWRIENNKTLNGIWLRVEQIPLTGNCRFRLGEQRFLFRVL